MPEIAAPRPDIPGTTSGGAVVHIATGLDFTVSFDFELREEALEHLQRQLLAAPVDARDALAPFVPVADAHQRRVIESPARTIRVVAPAGSGKTQTVTNRLLHRIRTGVHPQRLLVLTFDTAAATTLNAFAYGLLRQYFPQEFRPIIPDYRGRRLVREAREALQQKSPPHAGCLPGNVEPRFFLEFFSLLKNELFDPRRAEPQRFADFMLQCPQARPFFPDPHDRELVRLTIEAVLWLFLACERLLQREGLMDFDDQKLRAYCCLHEHPQTLKLLQRSYDEVIVDEFQDINYLDFVLIRAIAAEAVLVVTGDDDQAIYGFRGCSPEYIINLAQHLGRPVESLELSINYRCPPNIVAHADRLIRHNQLRIPKRPVAHQSTPSNIQVVSSISAGLEARLVVSCIQMIRQANPHLTDSDFAVLYRTNAQSLPLQIEFLLHDIPFAVRVEDDILRNESIARLLGVLRLKLCLAQGRAPTPEDQLHTVCAYFRYVDGRDQHRLRALFGRGLPFLELIVSEPFYAVLPKARESAFATAVHEVLAAGSLLGTLDVLARRFHGLRGMIGSLEDAIEEKVPLGEIYEIAANFRGDTAAFVAMLQRALEQARQRKAAAAKPARPGRAVGEEPAGVQLLTFFKAKGRQWHTVILTSCNERLIPHHRAPLEDERRLFYVAMTRATSNLVISYVQQACATAVQPSRFLREAGLL